MTDSTETIESTDRNAGITDAGARRLLFGSTVFSIIVGFAWGWCLYPSFEDPAHLQRHRAGDDHRGCSS